ncbi:MAG: glycine--tRNA ligase subunit beta [Methylococcales bacterium]|nr:glycine--tRNA ligase subunit beta [Methylococcales bacterium]
MSQAQDFLFELGTEELPPKNLRRLSQALQTEIEQGLAAAQLPYQKLQSFATPRRLAILIHQLDSQQQDRIQERKGPALKAAFDDQGKPSKAAEAFARSVGLEVSELEHLETDKGAWLLARQTLKGQATETLLPDIIRTALAKLPIAKRMRWGISEHEFVRPVHWLVLLFGERVIDTEILGLSAGRNTYGHRFHAPESLTLTRPGDYQDVLRRQGWVIADFAERQHMIEQAAIAAGQAVGGQAHIEAELLEEVAALSEWPVAVTGRFDPAFLELPKEVLISTMQGNQKYFPVLNQQGGLAPYFITFSNLDSKNPEVIRTGNERVITPRLRDAQFFWQQDRKKPLAERFPALENIVFQKTLGTLADKTRRLQRLAGYLAERWAVEGAQARRAATLAKTDLVTEMVLEFPQLQGIMGHYYALADTEPKPVAEALEQHYWPKHAGAETATGAVAQVLSVADKLDTLCGIFAAGLIPTGDKDPYALRRAALGILRTLTERQRALSLTAAIDFALQGFSHDFDAAATHGKIRHFIDERLRGLCLEQGYSAEEFDAVASIHPDDAGDFLKRLAAVRAFRSRPEAESLAAANKRIRNILKKAEGRDWSLPENLPEAAEQALLEAARQALAAIAPVLEQGDYQAALQHLAALKQPVDRFFDEVMVMTDDAELRHQRLGLLQFIEHLFLRIADIAKLP